MKKEINISETEWRVMEVLWQKSMQSIGEIKKALDAYGWSDSTVKTLVRRLVSKGALGIDETVGHFRYYPIADEEECRLKETKNLINRIYHGSVKMLMASLASKSSLSNDETEQLMAIIEKIDGGAEK